MEYIVIRSFEKVICLEYDPTCDRTSPICPCIDEVTIQLQEGDILQVQSLGAKEVKVKYPYANSYIEWNMSLPSQFIQRRKIAYGGGGSTTPGPINNPSDYTPDTNSSDNTNTDTDNSSDYNTGENNGNEFFQDEIEVPGTSKGFDYEWIAVLLIFLAAIYIYNNKK